MGAVSDLQSLGLESRWEVLPYDGRITRILKSTGNWLYSNKRGMLFGLVMAAGIMTAMSTLSQRHFKRRFNRTLAGVAIGSPLGVCVNCATPVMRGMHATGTSLETSLALMFSSPSFNVIALTMLFTMFPWYFVLIKIGLSLLLVFVGVPLLGRLWKGKVKGDHSFESQTPESCPVEFEAGWLSASWWSMREIVKKFVWDLRAHGSLYVPRGSAGCSSKRISTRRHACQRFH